MNRTKKNIIMIVIAVLLAGCMAFTSYSASNSLTASPGMGQPPQMQSDQQMPGGPDQDDQNQNDQNQNDQSQNSQDQNDQGSSSSKDSNASQDNSATQDGNASQDGSADKESAGQPPTPPDGSAPPDGATPPDGNTPPDGGTPPDFNGGQNGQNGQSDQGGPQDNQDAQGNQDNQDAQGNQDNQNGPQGGPQKSGSSLTDISSGWYILFGAEGLAFALVLIYLIMSNMNHGTISETFRSRKRLAAFAIASLLLAGCLVPAQAALTTKVFAGSGMKQDQQMQGGPGGQESSVEATGATTVDGTEETLNDEYSSSEADENAILVTGGGKLTSDGATISKESGDSSNTESSDFSGVNSGLLVQEDSSATISNATITTSAKGANAVFATGENAKISISDSTITTSGEASSRGLDATYGGTIEADNVKITTQGGSCAAMATDRGEGTVTATGSDLETNGAGSPIIYSTGDISLTDSKGTANGAQITVVEGKNSATIENSTLTCSGAGNRGDVDIAGVMIYQSMSGDADEGTGNFTARNSSLSIAKDSSYYKTAPMFFVTNTDAVIDLENTDLNFGSGTLLSACGTDEWGSEGSNGGKVTLNAKAEDLTGDIDLDELSSLSMNLTGSSYEGTINGDNEAEAVSLTLDKDSKITLTGDSYVSSLEDADSDYSNIDFNGHTLYVDGKAIN